MSVVKLHSFDDVKDGLTRFILFFAYWLISFPGQVFLLTMWGGWAASARTCKWTSKFYSWRANDMLMSWQALRGQGVFKDAEKRRDCFSKFGRCLQLLVLPCLALLIMTAFWIQCVRLLEKFEKLSEVVQRPFKWIVCDLVSFWLEGSVYVKKL